MSDSEIAESLSLSPRTVETHVHRILAKVNIEDRDQLISEMCRRDGVERPAL